MHMIFLQPSHPRKTPQMLLCHILSDILRERCQIDASRHSCYTPAPRLSMFGHMFVQKWQCTKTEMSDLCVSLNAK